MALPIGDLDSRHVASSWAEKPAGGAVARIGAMVFPGTPSVESAVEVIVCWRSTFLVGDCALSGAFPGDSPPEGSRLCIAEQADPAENDFYIYSSTGAWVRDESVALKSGMIVSLHSEQFLAQLVTVGPVRGSSDIVFAVLTALQIHGVAGFLSMLIESDNQSIVTDITFPSSSSIRYGLSIRAASAVYEDQGMTAVTIPAAGTTWPFQCATVRVVAENLTMTTAPWSAAVIAEHGGKYAISVRYYDASNGAWPAATQLILGVYVNGSIVEELDDVVIGPTQLFRMNGAYLLDLADGDVVTVEVRQTGGASQGTVGGGRSYVSIHRIPG